MKILPIILVALGGLIFVAGIAGIIFFVDIICDTPEEIPNMSTGDFVTIYGKISEAPVNTTNGKEIDENGRGWVAYQYEFEGGYVFYASNDEPLNVEEGSYYVINLRYSQAANEGNLPYNQPCIEGTASDAVSGTFTYRLPGIGVMILGLGIAGVGIFLFSIDMKKKIDKSKERSRKKEAVSKQMELLEREIQMAMGAAAPRQDLQYQAPPGQQQMPQQGPPQMPPGQQPTPPTGQMPPQGPPRPPHIQ